MPQQADQWEQYAAQPSGGDEWDRYAVAPTDTSAKTGGSDQSAPFKTFNQQLTEERPLAPFDSAHPIKSIAHDVGTELGNVGAGGINSIESMRHPIDTVKSMIHAIPSMLSGAGGSEPIDPGYAVGSIIPFLGAGETIPMARDTAKIIGDIKTNGMGDTAARILRSPKNDQITAPFTNLVGGDKLLDRIVPSRPEFRAKATADELGSKIKEAEDARQKELAGWEKLKTQDANARVTRGNQQESLDEAHADRLASVEKERQGQLADAERLKTQHANALNSREGETIPSVGKPAKLPSSFTLNTEMPNLNEGAGTPTGANAIPQVSTGPAKLKFVDKFEPKGSSKIVSPDSEPPDQKVTYQSIPRPQLYEMAKKGDLEAGRELIRNPAGFALPPNFKYLIEEAGTKPWRNYRR